MSLVADEAIAFFLLNIYLLLYNFIQLFKSHDIAHQLENRNAEFLSIFQFVMVLTLLRTAYNYCTYYYICEVNECMRLVVFE